MGVLLTAEAFYGRTNLDIPLLTNSAFERFFAISIVFHKLLGYKETFKTTRSRVQKKLLVVLDPPPIPIHQVVLQSYPSPSNLHLKSVCIAKTAVMFAPSTVESSMVTVAIPLFKSLFAQYTHLLTAAGIHFILYVRGVTTIRNLDMSVNVLIAQVEAYNSVGFRSLLTNLH
jgi:hypothetical protein